jgi:hypothetical protein
VSASETVAADQRVIQHCPQSGVVQSL